ncbi:MAG: ribosomal-processing cysteine protease Prp [Lachnospiraceae bacterium]|nr:ribosomal-processing cysteine protease Prp [Lachnospiraceae bacterium]
MITVHVSKQQDGVPKQFCMDGHAGFAEYGNDIVCAAVSALFINTVNAIETFTEDPFQLEMDDKKDRIVLQMSGEIHDGSAILLRALLLGLDGIQEEYGEEYIRIICK